jgi:hypothetical protein
MLSLLFAFALALAQPAAAPAAAPPPPSAHLAKIMSRGDGRSAETAYKVASVREEYEIVRALGLEMKSQALVMRKKPYDVLTVRDPRDGSTRALWFDIGSFFPEI